MIVPQVAFITDVIEDMISTYYTNNVAADENFLDHMYRIVSYDYKDLIFLLHVRRYHELDPSQPGYHQGQPILTRDGVGNRVVESDFRKSNKSRMPKSF